MRCSCCRACAGPTLTPTLAISLLFAVGAAWAQVPDPPPTSDAPASGAPDWTPPMLRSAPPVPYPPDALAAHTEGAVVVELGLDAEGRVLDAAVVESGGEGFDQALMGVVHDFVFSPALDAERQPTPARIQYRYTFTQETIGVVSIEGRVRAAGSRDGVVGASVVAVQGSGADAVRVAVTTGPEGSFELDDLAAGSWQLLAGAPGFGAADQQVEVSEGQVVVATFWLSPDRPWESPEASEVMEVVGYRMEPEITEHHLDASQVRVLPGSGGDIIRAVQTLPGVARTPFNAGMLLVRGTPPDASAFYLGGGSIPLVFHFGGLSTAVNGDLLQEVRFLPGGYGVRYGRKLGGVIDLVPRTTVPASSHGYASVDLFQAAAFHRQRLGEHGAMAVSLRRSYLDAFLNPVVNQDPSYQVRLPRYMDGQLAGLYRNDHGSVLQGMILGSDDRFTLNQLDSDGGTTQSKLVLRFLKGQVSWIQPMAGGWQSELDVVAGPEELRATYQVDEQAYETAERENLRFELTRPVPEGGAVGWRMGLDLNHSHQRFSYQVDNLDGFFIYAENEKGAARIWEPGLYLEQTQRAGRFEATPGVRVDWMRTNHGYQAMAVDPRIRAQARLGSRTRIDAAVGKYSQFPQLRELQDNGTGVPSLGPEWEIQSTLGLKHQLLPELSLEGMVYHYWLWDLVVGHDNRFQFQLAPPPMAPYDLGSYANDGTGRTYGLELLARYQDARTFAFAAATFSHAVRVERPGQAPSLFEYDQPVVLTLVGSRELPKGFRVGTRLRYTTGNPYTPVVNRIYDLDQQAWLPIFADSNVERVDAWFAVDLRVDKEWTFHKWALTLYLDVQNLTNRKNVEMLNFTPDFASVTPVYGLPILPTFGLKGAW